MTAPVVPPSVHEPSLPPGFDGVVLRAMSRAPADRFASVNELGAALLRFAPAAVADAFRAEFGAEAAADGGAPPALDATLQTGVSSSAGRRGPKLTTALVAALLALGASFWLWRSQLDQLRTREQPVAPARAQPEAAHVVTAGAATPAATDTPQPTPALGDLAPALAGPAPTERSAPRRLAASVTAPAPARTPPRAASPRATRAPNEARPVTYGENGAPILE